MGRPAAIAWGLYHTKVIVCRPEQRCDISINADTHKPEAIYIRSGMIFVFLFGSALEFGPGHRAHQEQINKHNYKYRCRMYCRCLLFFPRYYLTILRYLMHMHLNNKISTRGFCVLLYAHQATCEIRILVNQQIDGIRWAEAMDFNWMPRYPSTHIVRNKQKLFEFRCYSIE